MYYHIGFKNGGNPYICKDYKEFLRMFNKYELETIKPGFYTALNLRQYKSYNAMKKASRNLAIEYSWTFPEDNLSYSELANLQTIFETLGKKYGLMEEFKENAII